MEMYFIYKQFPKMTLDVSLAPRINLSFEKSEEVLDNDGKTKKDRVREGAKSIEFVTLAASNGVREYDTAKIECLCETGLIRHGVMDMAQTHPHSCTQSIFTKLSLSRSDRQTISIAALDKVTKRVCSYIYRPLCFYNVALVLMRLHSHMLELTILIVIVG